MALITDMPDNLTQEPLIEAAFIKFSGTSNGTLDDPPALDEERTYVVKAICKAQHKDRRADNEDRLTVTMGITAVWEQGKVPIVDEAQPSLFDDAMAAEGDDEGDEDESGDGGYSEPKRAFDPEQRLDGHGPKLFSASDA